MQTFDTSYHFKTDVSQIVVYTQATKNKKDKTNTTKQTQTHFQKSRGGRVTCLDYFLVEKQLDIKVSQIYFFTNKSLQVNVFSLCQIYTKLPLKSSLVTD